MIAALRPALSATARSAFRSAPVARAGMVLPRATFATSQRALAEKILFTSSHEYVAFDDQSGVGKVGITEYAGNQLGDVVFVEAKPENTIVKQGDELAAIESVKAASELFAPVSGTVVEINSEVSESPDLLNNDPYANGWIVKLKLSNPAELEQLLSEDAYKKHIETADH